MQTEKQKKAGRPGNEGPALQKNPIKCGPSSFGILDSGSFRAARLPGQAAHVVESLCHS